MSLVWRCRVFYARSERGWVETEDFRCTLLTADTPVGLFQHITDVLPFHVSECQRLGHVHLVVTLCRHIEGRERTSVRPSCFRAKATTVVTQFGNVRVIHAERGPQLLHERREELLADIGSDSFENSAEDRPGLRRLINHVPRCRHRLSLRRRHRTYSAFRAINEGATVVESSTGWENEAMRAEDNLLTMNGVP